MSDKQSEDELSEKYEFENYQNNNQAILQKDQHIHDYKMERIHTLKEFHFEERRSDQETRFKLNENMANLGIVVLKTFMLINGGAAIALLAYLGHLKTIPSETFEFQGIVRAIYAFVWGIIFVAVSAGAAYACQHFYSLSFESRLARKYAAQREHQKAAQKAVEENTDIPKDLDLEEGSKERCCLGIGHVFQYICIALAITGLVLFCFGVKQAIDVLTQEAYMHKNMVSVALISGE